MESDDALRSTDDHLRARAFERAVLRALAIEEEDAPIMSWAEAYARVSSGLTGRGGDAWIGPSTAMESPRGAQGSLDSDAIWGLIYGARTFHVAHRLLAAYPPAAGAFVEVGAGWGPFGLAAALHGSGPVSLVDVSGTRLERASALFKASGAPPPNLVRSDVLGLALPRVAGIAVPYALGELAIANDDAHLAGLVRGWLDRLQPGGRLYLVEPGTHAAARRVQALRDRLIGEAAILAPCVGAPSCPLLADARDWCHLTWRLALGPLAQRVADRAQRRWQELHLSWLVLARAEEQSGALPGSARLLELRSLGKAKLHARFCTELGAPWLTVLRRNRAEFDSLLHLEPGARVRIRREALQPRGDGLRIAEPGTVTFERPL